MAGNNEEAIKTKLVVEGEKEYKKACSGINTSLREIGSEMRVVSAEFAGNEKSTEALRKKQDLLKKTLAEQSQKVKEAEKALKQFADGGVDESSDAVIGMKTALNSAKAEMIKTENQIKATNKELKQSKIDWSAVGSTVGKVAAGFGKALAAFGGAALGAASALAGLTVSGATLADDLLTQSSQTRISTTDLQKYQYALNFIDGDMESLTGSMKKNIKSMSNAAKGSKTTAAAYKKLGVNVTNSDGSLRDSNDVYWESIDALKKIENPTERDALAMELFGKSATELNPIIDAGSEAFRKMGDEAESMGAVMSEEQLAALGSFKDKLDKLSAGLGGLKNSASLIALPFLDTLAGDGITILGDFSKSVNEANGDVSLMSGAVGTALSGIISMISSQLPTFINMGMTMLNSLVQGIVDSLPTITESAVTIVTSLCDGLITMLPTILNGAVQLVTGLAQGIAAAIPTLLPTIVQVITSIVTTLIENIPLLIDAALQLVTGLAQGVLNAIPVLIAAVPTIITSLITSILESIPLIIQAGIDLISSLVTSLPTIIETIVAAIPQIITGILTALTTNVPLIVQAGIDLITSLITSLPTIIETIVAAIPQIITGITTSLIEAAPLLVQAGVDLFGQLIANLPVIIENIIAAAPQIIEGLVGAFGNLGESVIAIGTNIVSGIWDGITGAAEWIAEKVSGFFRGILGGICDFLGIHSPSTVFADTVGKNMAAGVGDGFTGEMSDVSTTMTGAMDSAGTVTAEQAIAAVNAGIMSNLSLLSEAIKAVVDAILTGLNTDSARLTAVGTTMLDAMVKGMVTAGATVAGKVNQIATAIASAFEAKKPIFTAEGVTMCKSVAQGLLDGMVAITANIPVMVDTMLINFVSQHPKLSSEGGEMDKQIGQGMIDNIGNITGKAAQIVQSIITAFSGFNSEFVFIGENMVAGIWQGFQNKQDWIEDQLRSMMRRLVKIVEDEMDINSPSKVFARIGEYMALGLGGGWKAQMSAVEKDIKKTTSNIIPTTTGARQADTSRARGGFNFTQNVYANETSYAEQQRQAARQFRLIARGLC